MNERGEKREASDWSLRWGHEATSVGRHHEEDGWLAVDACTRQIYISPDENGEARVLPNATIFATALLPWRRFPERG